MNKIRQWFTKDEDCRRTLVKVEKGEKAEKHLSADARHGILPLAGRRVG